MNQTKQTFVALFAILVLGTFLRFFHLTTVPPSLSHDEVAIAYNAYSILKTGKDEYGKSYPLLFRSFDDYKLSGMVYASIPAVALFGKTAMGARFTSAFLGSFTILFVYLLVVELMANNRSRSGYRQLQNPHLYALASAFFFAISPWHINFSRQLFESNGALFFITLSTYVLLKSQKTISFLLLSSFLFGISVYFYYSVRLVIPFIVIAYFFVNKKQLLLNKTIVIISAIIFLTSVFPVARLMFSKEGLERVNIVSLVNDPNYYKWKDIFIQRYAKNQNIPNKIFFNQKTALVMTAFDNYWKNISPLHVFSSGTSTYGLQHPFEIPFIFIGILFLVTYPNPFKWVLIAWFAAAFLPGALSTNQPNALRTLLGSPFLSICSGIGAVELFFSVEKNKRFRFGIVPFGLLFIFFFYAFYQSYFIVNPARNSLAFGDGYEQMIRYVKSHETQYDRVVISGYYWRPYIFMLYWGDTDPTLFQREGTRNGWGKYVFTGAEWDKNEIFLKDPLYDPKQLIGTTSDKTLFILASPEYENNLQRYKLIEKISGRHAPSVFVAVLAT